MSDKVITVAGDRPYDVVIGTGLTSRVPEKLPAGAVKVLVVFSAPLASAAGELVRGIEATGREVLSLEIPDAEAGKTSKILVDCWRSLGQAGFTRSDAVVGFGGGAVTDLAGFVAASWLRGIPVVQVPTTLLGMVDAAIGGKTGINTEEGKNLVGAFHVPSSVWCDLDRLRTLPHADFIAGLGEVVKAGFIQDREILRIVQDNLDVLARGQDLDTAMPIVGELVVRSVAVKARVVGEDLKEAFLREILNYGHTFGHAIEHVEHFTWRHGEAVSVGMVFAAELARLDGLLTDDEVALHRTLLGGLGLPVAYRGGRWTELLDAMRRDKKARGSLLRFVVLDGIGNPIRLEGPDEEKLKVAYDAISE